MLTIISPPTPTRTTTTTLNAPTLPLPLLSFLLCWGWLSFLPEAETMVNLRGAGASFPGAVYQSWMPAFRASRQAHVSLNMTYELIGSGKGKARIVANAGDLEYAGSDSLLKDSERHNKTDLVLFPTMAGGAVMAYNLPGCTDTLNLTRHQVVGIYNGTIRFWNETSLQDSNPRCQLPDEGIKVIARQDKSGTTDMFTSTLSSFSQEWNLNYGVFSQGQDSSKWDPSVIYLYGKGNNGMSGLVVSLHYSIGYMAVSQARLVQLPYARLQNKVGKFTLPTSTAIQAAMDSHVQDSLTVSLVDSDSQVAYPIASYTYLVIYLTSMTNCDSAKELVRYADWFMTSETARKDCEKNQMVPLSSKISDRIHQEILSKVTCKGRNMWDEVVADRQRENASAKEWVVPIAVTVPLFCLILLALLGHIGWQRRKMLRLIANDDWDIAIEDILFFEDKQYTSSGKSRCQVTTSLKSFVCVDDVPDGAQMLSQILQWPGKWRANVIGIRLMELSELRHVTRPLKRSMLWMRDVVVHPNLVRFFGLTQLDKDRYVVGEYCSKGSMVDILQNGKYNLNNDFKFSLAADIAAGMAFLHASGLVHGLLTSSCCLLDARWTVKIADWEFCRLLSIIYPKKSPLMRLFGEGVEDKNSHAAAFKEFWVAPELIRAEFLQAPAMSCDVFSFGIILQEIYTREDPYYEHADTMTPREVVRAVCNNHLRPEPTEDIPIRIRQIMEIAWSDNPAFRPSFEQMVKMLRQSRTSRKTLLDSMMETMEEYTHHLEDQVAERSAEVTLAKRNLETFLTASLPPHLASRIVNGETSNMAAAAGGEMMVEGREYAHLGVVVMEVVGVHAALLECGAKEVLMVLNDMCISVDAIVREYGAFRGPLQGDIQIIALGLEFETTFLDQRCATVTHLALHLLSLLPPSLTTTHPPPIPLGMRAGAHVGRVVTGMLGGTVPRLVLLGEGVEVSRALAVSSQAGRVRVSRNVFSHLEKNLDFVSEEAGWIMCAGMEVESFWMRFRIPKTFQSTLSDNSVDSGVELEKPQLDSNIMDTGDTEQHVPGEGPPERDMGPSHHREAVREIEGVPRFFQLHTVSPQQTPARAAPRGQPSVQPSLSDITEEDERQASPLLQQQQQQQQQQTKQQQEKSEKHPRPHPEQPRHHQQAQHQQTLQQQHHHQQQQQQKQQQQPEQQQREKYLNRNGIPNGMAESTLPYKQPVRITVETETANHHPPPHLVPAVHIINTHSTPSESPTPQLNGSAYTHAANKSPSNEATYSTHHRNHSFPSGGIPAADGRTQRRENGYQTQGSEQAGVWYIPVSTHTGRSARSPHTVLEEMESPRVIHNVGDNHHRLQHSPHSRHSRGELLTAQHPGELSPRRIQPLHVETPHSSTPSVSGQSAPQMSPLSVPHNKHPVSRSVEHERYGGYLLVPHSISHNGNLPNAHHHAFKPTDVGYFDSGFSHYSPSLRVPQPSGSSPYERYNAHYFTPLSHPPHTHHSSDIEMEELRPRHKWLTSASPVPLSSGQVASTSLTRFPVLLPPLPRHSPVSSVGTDGGEGRRSRQRLVQDTSQDSETPITSQSSFSGYDGNGDRDTDSGTRKSNCNTATVRRNKHSASPVKNDRNKTVPAEKNERTTVKNSGKSGISAGQSDTERVSPRDRGRLRSKSVEKEGIRSKDLNRARKGSGQFSSSLSPTRPGRQRSRSLGRTSKKSNKVHPQRKK